MKKYIDAEKLKAEIERLGRNWDGVQELQPASLFQADLYELLDIINSLQQEPRFPQENNIVEKVFGAGNLESWEYREAEMLVALAKEELLKSLKQEQPEVDLEEEIDRFLKSEESTTYENAGSYKVAVKEPKKIARHFYELGLKARKEE